MTKKKTPEPEGNPLPRSTPAVLPDLDPETQRGVTPLPATAVNPSQFYDDSAKG